MTTQTAAKVDSRKLRKVEDLFNEQIANGTHPGAAVAAYYKGEPILDLCGGVADETTGRKVQKDSMFMMFSCTKPLGAACMHLLWERGKFRWDDPVVKHWPTFGKHGKDKVTIRHVLTHTSGFPITPKELTADKLPDWDFCVRAMENITPDYAPGTQLAYHALNYGWMVAELVHRLDGRMFDRFLREEIAVPLGLKDTHVGLPASEEGRVCRVHEMPDVAGRQVASLDPVLQGNALIVMGNTPAVHQSVQPAAFGIASARDMAKFYAMYVGLGQVGGVRVMKPETVGGAIAKQLEANTPQGVLQKRALGHMLEAATYGVNPNPRSFGHGGAGTTVAWGDPDAGLAVCILTNGFRENTANQKRLQAMSQAIRDAVG